MNYEIVYKMSFQEVYKALVNKALRKGRTKDEVNEIISWLTGYPKNQIEDFEQNDILYGEFFQRAPRLNPDRRLITGSICGVKVETIEEPLMQEIRYLDKIVVELAKGKALEKIEHSSCKESKLWKCPKCNREFKKEYQSHYCGEKPKTINEYILVRTKVYSLIYIIYGKC